MQVWSHLDSHLSTPTWKLIIFRNRKICILKQLFHRKHQQHNPSFIPALVLIQRSCWWSKSASWEALKVTFYIILYLSPFHTIETKALSWKEILLMWKLMKITSDLSSDLSCFSGFQVLRGKNARNRAWRKAFSLLLQILFFSCWVFFFLPSLTRTI